MITYPFQRKPLSVKQHYDNQDPVIYIAIPIQLSRGA